MQAKWGESRNKRPALRQGEVSSEAHELSQVKTEDKGLTHFLYIPRLWMFLVP